MSLTKKLQAAQKGVVFIGATERLCREMRQQRALMQATSDQAGWLEEVVISTFTNWLREEWLSLIPEQQLLHHPQYLTLCKQIIDRSKEAEGCISTTSLARTFQKAHTLSKAYGINRDREHYLFKAETESYLRWSSALDLMLNGSDYVIEADLPELMGVALKEGTWKAPDELILVGFTDLPPQMSGFLERLEQSGVAVSYDRGFSRAPDVSELYIGQMVEDELTHAARSAAQMLSECGEDPFSAPRMAIVVPNIDDARDLIVDTLERNVAPHALVVGDEGSIEDRVPYSFAGGEPLDHFGVIRTGLDILQIQLTGNDIEVISRLIRTPFMEGSVQERSARAKIDIALRKNTGRHIGMSQVLKACEQRLSEAPILFQRMQAVETLLKASDKRRLPSGWAAFFEEVLKAMGWPDLQNAHSYNYQAWQAWMEVFDVLRSMDNQLGHIPVEPAYMWLRELTSTRRFSPRKPWHTPLQILSYADAIGLHFDRAWVVGLDSNAVPGHKSPNPLIPVNLQVKAGIAEASSEGMLAKAERLIPFLQEVASHVTLSCSLQGGDGTPLTPTALIDWSEAKEMPETKTLITEIFEGTSQTYYPVNDDFPPVDSDEVAMLQGGVSLFADFAQDPFVAAMRHRLHLREFPVTTAGLDAATQGTVTHACLKELWLRIKSQEKLLAMDEEEIRNLVKDSVSAAIKKEKLLPVSRYGRRLVTLEHARNEKLINEWLELERDRTDNFEVVGVEVPAIVDIAGIKLNVDIDRLDKVSIAQEGGEPIKKVLPLDYKTGNSIPLTSLNSSKLTEPQMPIYVTFVDYSEHGNVVPDGAAFAQIVRGAPRFHVRSNWTSELVPSKRTRDYPANKETWDGQIKAWRDGLIELSLSLQGGEARLRYRPHSYLGYHAYLAPLMRLNERGEQ